MSIKIIQVSVILVIILLCSNCTTAIIDEGENQVITEEVKYDPVVKEIMFNHCITCHGGPAPNAGIDLSTYENVKYYIESGKLLSRIENASNPMPPSGLLTNPNRQKIAKWVKDGFK